MTPQEKELLQKFLDNVESVQAPQPDTEAQQLISRTFSKRPEAAYLVVQQALLQQLSLNQAGAKIAELQKALNDANARGASTATSSFLGGNARNEGGWSAPPYSPGTGQAPQNAFGNNVNAGIARAPSGMSSFLQSAATTAAGVAGGALLFQGLENLFGHGGNAWGSGFGGMHPDMVEHTTVINEYVNDVPSSDEWGRDDDVNDSGDALGDDGNDDGGWV